MLHPQSAFRYVARLLFIGLLPLVVAGTVEARMKVEKSKTSTPPPTDSKEAPAGLPALPPNADKRVDQSPYVLRGFYLTEAGVLTPLPSKEDEQPDEEDNSIPAMKLH